MNNPVRYAELENRGILRISGPDRKLFLQGLLTNDIDLLTPDRSLYAALLSPQGKFLHDMFLVETGDAILVDCEANRRDDLLKRLRPYKLRSKTEFSDETGEWKVLAIFGDLAFQDFGLPEEIGCTVIRDDMIISADPRLAVLGIRLLVPQTKTPNLPAQKADFADYDLWRLKAGVPDGSRDMPVDKAILLENNLDRLNAISWTKGCYIGQELTARTKYRGLVRKRLLPVLVEGSLPPSGTPVMAGDQEVGILHSGRHSHALALLRTEELKKADHPLHAAGMRLHVTEPEWMQASDP